jgi:ketosteroid isomerase-like protein
MRAAILGCLIGAWCGCHRSSMPTEDTAGNKAFVLEMIGQKKQLRDYPDRSSDSMVVYEPASLPFGGTYRGIKAFEQFYPKVREFYDFTHFELQNVYADGDKVFAISKATIAHTSDSLLLCEELTFADGKIVEVRLYFYDSRPVQESIADASAYGGAHSGPDERSTK